MTKKSLAMQANEIIRLAEGAGWSIAKIADEMRVSTTTVSTKLKEAGMNITAVMDA